MTPLSRMPAFLLAGLVCLLLPLWPASAEASPIDINTASESEFTTLPGIGPSRASAIVEDRRANGPFRSVEDLQRVPGIGPATMNNIRALVVVGDADGGDAASAPPAAPAAPAAPPRRGERGDDIDLSDAPPETGEMEARDPAPPRAAPAAPPRSDAAQPAPQGGGHLININTASAGELVRLPMIGAARADAIIADREERGPFRTARDITRVSGIGDGIFRQIEDLITVGEVE